MMHELECFNVHLSVLRQGHTVAQCQMVGIINSVCELCRIILCIRKGLTRLMLGSSWGNQAVFAAISVSITRDCVPIHIFFIHSFILVDVSAL